MKYIFSNLSLHFYRIFNEIVFTHLGIKLKFIVYPYLYVYKYKYIFIIKCSSIYVYQRLIYLFKCMFSCLNFSYYLDLKLAGLVLE